MGRAMTSREPVAPEKVADEAWQRLTRAADDPADPFRVVTLCTVTPEGRPAGRLMLLRGADRESGRVWCHCRRESGKVVDLRATPFVAIVAYDAATCVQIRLAGSARVHELDHEATDHFRQSIHVKQSAPPVPDSNPDPIWPGEAEALIHLSRRESRKHFAVIEILIESIDWTQVVPGGLAHVLLEAESRWRPKVLP
jgi:hypothetical protein